MKQMKKVKQRKMLMVLPVLIIPFLTLGFYALGGGSTKTVSNESTDGLNVQLPDPNLKNENLMDKLSFYEKARKDSLKMAEWMRSDPYYNADENGEYGFEKKQLNPTAALRYKPHLKISPYEKQSNPEEKILQQLTLLEKQINDPVLPDEYLPAVAPVPESLSQEVNRLEAMMEMMQKGSIEDPEIKKLETTLEKILDIQHTGRIKERMKNEFANETTKVFAVSEFATEDTITEGFYGMSDEEQVEGQQSIAAVVHDNQTLVNGAVIKLRLQQDIYINGSLIPRGQFLFGLVSLNGERLEIEIESIRNKQQLLPVRLKVFDMDGIEGIYIPGAITRDVAKQSTDHSLQLVELSGMDQSLKTQAASAGLNTAKNLLSKKIKLVKVSVKAGYKVLLKG